MLILKSLFWQTINATIKIFLEILVFDKKIRRILKGNWAKFYLRKYVYSSKQTDFSKDKKKDTKRIIWQYWESPDDKIPPLVQACLNSVKRYKGNWERKLLTPQNIRDYVSIPEIFLKLKEKGIIKTAFFSDVLRTCLLIQNGGIWIDATVLLTDYIPDCIKESDFFVFQNDLKSDLDGLNMASYFIVSKPQNKILKETLNALILYWQENKFLINYFTFLHTFTMVTQKNNENKNLFRKIPYFNFLQVQHLQNMLLEEFDEARWQELKKASPIHKLTHKKNVLTKNKILITSDTFYEHIIQEFCGENNYEA